MRTRMLLLKDMKHVFRLTLLERAGRGDDHVAKGGRKQSRHFRVIFAMHRPENQHRLAGKHLLKRFQRPPNR